MTDKPVKVSQDIIDMARAAKSFIAGSGEASLPDESLMRAAVTSLTRVLKLREPAPTKSGYDDEMFANTSR